MPIFTTEDVAPEVQATAAELDEDPLAMKLVSAVSLLVNQTVFGLSNNSAYWANPDAAHPAAKLIAEQLFARLYQNPQQLASYTIGPITDRHSEVTLTGMAFRPNELETLNSIRGAVSGQGSGGFWSMSLAETDTDLQRHPVPCLRANGDAAQPGLPLSPSDYDHARYRARPGRRHGPLGRPTPARPGGSDPGPEDVAARLLGVGEQRPRRRARRAHPPT